MNNSTSFVLKLSHWVQLRGIECALKILAEVKVENHTTSKGSENGWECHDLGEIREGDVKGISDDDISGIANNEDERTSIGGKILRKRNSKGKERRGKWEGGEKQVRNY